MKRFSFVLLLTSVLLLSQPVSADFPVEGTYFSLESSTAEPFSQYDDKVVLIEAFATWCEPCKAEMNELHRLQSVYGDNLTLFSISVSPSTDSLDKIASFKEEVEDQFGFHADWEFGLVNDGAGQTFAYQMNISVIPTSILIDDDGSVVKKWEGVVEAENVSAYIDANITFPEFNRSQALLNQVLDNNFFKVFMVIIVILVLYRLLVPSAIEEQDDLS